MPPVKSGASERPCDYLMVNHKIPSVTSPLLQLGHSQAPDVISDQYLLSLDDSQTLDVISDQFLLSLDHFQVVAYRASGDQLLLSVDLKKMVICDKSSFSLDHSQAPQGNQWSPLYSLDFFQIPQEISDHPYSRKIILKPFVRPFSSPTGPWMTSPYSS